MQWKAIGRLCTKGERGAKATKQTSRRRVKGGVGRNCRDADIYEKRRMSDIVPARANDSSTKEGET